MLAPNTPVRIPAGLVVTVGFRHHARMQETLIHPSAVINPRATLGARVSIGAYAVIGAGVEIGDDCDIGPHVVLSGPMVLGARNRLSAHATLGLAPQDNSYNDEPTRLEVGTDNIFREFVTIHRASTKEDGITRIGNRNLLMAYSHVGHDGRLGDDITIANASQLAGHVHVQDRAYISALCGIHQFVHIGTLAMVGGGAVVTQDVAPFSMVAGNRARLRGLNTRGIERAGLDKPSSRCIRKAHTRIFRSGSTLADAIADLQSDPAMALPEIKELIAFIQSSTRGIIR